MASYDQLLLSEVKKEIDVTEDPGPEWMTQDTNCHWSGNSGSTTDMHEMNAWNPLVSVNQFKPNTQSYSCQGIKTEPVDQSDTNDEFHHTLSQSGNNREGKVDIRHVSYTCVGLSSTPLDSWNAECSQLNPRNNISKVKLEPFSCSESDTSYVTSNARTEPVRANTSSGVKTEPIRSDTSGDIKLEPVSDIMMTETCHAIRSQPSSSMDEDRGEPPGDGQKHDESLSAACQVPGSGRKPFACDVCSKTFTRAGHLEEHKRIHIPKSLFVCDVCNKTFTQAADLKKHKRIHAGQRPYACDVCSKTFTQKGDLKKHTRIHTGQRPYACDVCSKSFTQGSDLKKHKRTHTGQKPYVCDVCSKAFARTGSLKEHKMIHTGQKPYACDVCCETFIRPRELKTHKLIHTGQKSFACGMSSNSNVCIVKLSYI